MTTVLSPNPERTDVLVLGGGPAGSATALFLARHGYSVVLVDRALFPRQKPCGEYLTPGAVRLLQDEIGVLPELLRRGAAPVQEERITGHSGRDFGGETSALSCPRSVTDDVLLQAARTAGVMVREGFTVRKILTENGRIAGAFGTDASGSVCEICAAVTVGADGTHSLLARTLGAVRPIARLQRLALVGHFRAECTAAAARTPGAVTMYLSRGNNLPGSCCGAGALCGPDGSRSVNANIVVPISEAGKIAGRREEYFRETLRRSFPDAWERFGGLEFAEPLQTVGCFAHHTARASHPGAVLVGDAATFIHPFTGEGVYFALRGAQLAAESIDAAFRAGKIRDSDALATYDRTRKREILPRYRLCDLVARIVHSPAMLGWVSERLRRSPVLADAILRTVGDVARPAELFAPSNLRLLLAAL